MAIQGIDGASSIAPTGATKPVAGGSSTDFADSLVNALGEANRADEGLQNLTERFVQGDSGVGVHEVVIAAEKASVQLRYAVTLKNRVIEAYRELMRTPI